MCTLSFYLLFILILFKIIDTELDINAADIQAAVLYQRDPAKTKLVTKNWIFEFIWLDIFRMCDAPGKRRKTQVKERDRGKVWAWMSMSV